MKEFKLSEKRKKIFKGCGKRLSPSYCLDYEYCGQKRHPKQSRLYCNKCQLKVNKLAGGKLVK